MAFTYGADPELFITRNGKPASAYGLLPGDKKNPHKTPGGAIQVDGMAAEFNIDPVPAGNFELFNERVVQQIKEIRNRVPGYNLKPVPVMDFGAEFLAAQPDEAKELGCDPDYNAYTLAKNPRPDGDAVTFRTAAGHVHIGWGADIPAENEEHIEICANFVKVLDQTLGLFMCIIDNEPRRFQLYGRAGCFRPKSYGVEYRTPSNVWITKRDYRRAVFQLMDYAVWYAAHRQEFQDVQDIINTGEKDRAYRSLRLLLANNSRWDNSNYRWLRTYVEKVYKEQTANVLD
jgi:Phage phiEco32-like COOH.NH2 ligase-type 2